MKRAIVMSIMGAAACMLMSNKAQAQGQVFFCNYAANGDTAPVTYSGVAFGGYTAGETIGQPFTAALLYSLNGGSTWANSGATASFLTSSGASAGAGGGLFGYLANTANIPGYSSGPIDFMVQVYNGSSYTASTIRGESGMVSLKQISTAANQLPPGGLFANNSQVTTPLSAFTVAYAVPEPTTLAFAGMGMLSLLALARRKKA